MVQKPVESGHEPRTKHPSKSSLSKLQAHLDSIESKHDLLIQTLKSFIVQLSADEIFNAVEQIFEVKMKLYEINHAANQTRAQLRELTEDDAQQSTATRNGFDQQQYNDLKSTIRRLRKDIKELQLKVQVFDNPRDKMGPGDQLDISQMKAQSNATVQTLVPQSNSGLLPAVDGLVNTGIQKSNFGTSSLTYLFFKQTKAASIDQKDDELNLADDGGKRYIDEGEEEEDEDAVAEFISSGTTEKITQRVHLSNNIVTYMRGPLKCVAESTVHAASLFAKSKNASPEIIRGVREILGKQAQTNANPRRTVFTEITSDWICEGENEDKGYSSASIWMHDPQGRRIMVKTQDLPICAASEWIAYVLGRRMGLPVNEVQIAIYESNLATLHTDVCQEDEKIVAVDQLPRKIRKILMTDPILGSMDLFDRLIQNADRNPKNILITASNSTDIKDDDAKLKVHFVDHGACFGMGKLNGVSVIASKVRTHHLSVVAFDPVEQAKQFDRYLSELSPDDRVLLQEPLNRFAAISNEQFEGWLRDVQLLLSASQYSRIFGVLYRQRDIAKRYMMDWGLYSKPLHTTSKRRNQQTVETNDTVMRF